MSIFSKYAAPKLALALLFIATMACNAVAATPTPGFGALQTVVALTLQAASAQPSPIPTFSIYTATPTQSGIAPTPIPTYVYTPYVPPTQYVPPTPTVVLPGATRLYFAVGTTQVVATGTIQPGETHSYYVRALEDQPVIATAEAPNGDLTLSVFGANGVTLLPATQGSATWQGHLPSTQDYYFLVHGGRSIENYTLKIVIAARVRFAPGEIKATLKGSTVNGYRVVYAAYAREGQKMDVILDVPGESASLNIWGFSDGKIYARAREGVRDFSLVLPATQDYIIEIVPQAERVVDYAITIKIK